MKCKTLARKKKLLKDTDDSVVTGVAECCYNLLHGNVTTTKKNMTRLGRYKKQLRKMANKKVAKKTKRQMLMQKGGFLVPLLSVLAPILTGIITSVTRQ
jgi:hypothetical protein